MEHDLHDEQHDDNAARQRWSATEQLEFHHEHATALTISPAWSKAKAARGFTRSYLPGDKLASTSAPADQYFGRLKMSALRIRYETMQLKKRFENHDLLPDQTLHLVLFTQDAFDEWARLYPKDPVARFDWI